MVAPLLEPAVKLTAIDASPATTLLTFGAAGANTGVTETPLDAVLSPTSLVSMILIEYVVPFVNPVIVSGLLVTAGEKAVHVEPPSIEYL